MMTTRVSRAAACAVLVLSSLIVRPAMAYKWPGETASVGSVLAAKAIGQNCQDVLSPAELAELDAFLAKAASEWVANPANANTSFEKFTSGLAAGYVKKYRDPKACDADASEEARDTLARVHKTMAAGGAIFVDSNDPNRRPELGEVLKAEIVAEKCDASLTALEWANLELYLARNWVAFAKSATDGDAWKTFKVYKSSQKDIADAWRAKDCTEAAIKTAKAVSALVQKALAASAH